jgi:septal ring factor EnvC (AmiA/AmiB activator)
MAKEPDNLVLELLREMRGDVRTLRERSEEHADELRKIRKEIHSWQETTATGVGFAMHANVRLETVEQRFEDLTKRIERLEKQK